MPPPPRAAEGKAAPRQPRERWCSSWVEKARSCPSFSANAPDRNRGTAPGRLAATSFNRKSGTRVYEILCFRLRKHSRRVRFGGGVQRARQECGALDRVGAIDFSRAEPQLM